MKPILKPILCSKHLELRLPTIKDALSIVKFYTKNKVHFSVTDSKRPSGFYTEKFWKEQIRKTQLEFKQDKSVRFFIFLNGSPIGAINFTQIFRGSFQACYLGYGIGKEFQGQGLMSEALATAIPYMFREKKIHRIMANYLPSNFRSAAVLKKLGFVIEGEAKNYLFINGKWRTHVLSSLTNFNIGSF